MLAKLKLVWQRLSIYGVRSQIEIMAMLSFPIGVAFNFNDMSERGCQFRSITVDNVAFVLFATSNISLRMVLVRGCLM